MKKIIGLSIVAVLIIGMVGAGTWAYFSDTETSTGNTFTAGTLDLNLDSGNVNVIKFTVSNANPGESGYGTWILDNTGNLGGYIDIENISFSNAENYDAATDSAESEDDGDTSNATGGGELGANLDIELFWDDGGNTGIANNGIRDGDEALIYSGDLDGIAGSYATDYSLGATSTTYLSMTWSVDSGVNNTIMGDSVTLNLDIELAQTTGQ